MKLQLSKITSVVRRLNLSHSVEIGPDITAVEGQVVAVEVLEERGTNNVLEHASGRLGRAVKGDVIPAAFGKRRALREYSSDIPTRAKAGDVLYLTCESGVIGEISGLNEEWGVPLKVKLLGSILVNGRPANLKQWAVRAPARLSHSAPIVAVVGTCMDCGKTTAIVELVKQQAALDCKVAFVKLTGVAFMQDPLRVLDSGAASILDFVDAGLPSTCGSPEAALTSALRVLNEINQSKPDLIVAEFGDGLIGEYHVSHLLSAPEIKQHLAAILVGANDIVGAWGALQLLDSFGLMPTLITGPAVNNATGVAFVEARLGVAAESNQHAMPKMGALVAQKLAAKTAPIAPHTPDYALAADIPPVFAGASV